MVLILMMSKKRKEKTDDDEEDNGDVIDNQSELKMTQWVPMHVMIK